MENYEEGKNTIQLDDLIYIRLLGISLLANASINEIITMLLDYHADDAKVWKEARQIFKHEGEHDA